jgi:hypothetical protein
LQYVVINDQRSGRRHPFQVDWGPADIDPADSFGKPEEAFAGFLFRHASENRPVVGAPIERSFVQIPFWAAIALASILPALWLVRRRRLTRRRRRADRGQCLACGYDLRQSPERCPECGLVVAENLRPFTQARSAAS